MIAYSARATNTRSVAVLRQAGWRMLVSPGYAPPVGFPYALDNGAWSAYTQDRPWDRAAFVRLLTRYGAGADWVVVPDIVAGGLASLAHSMAWLPRVQAQTPRVLLAVQDGMQTTDLAGLLSPQVGIFIGGTTTWKLATLPDWCRLGMQVECWTHVGRVNTARRITACAFAGATSFDGSSVARFAKTLSLLDNARRQLVLFGGNDDASSTYMDGKRDHRRGAVLL